MWWQIANKSIILFSFFRQKTCICLKNVVSLWANMEKTNNINSLDDEFDYSAVPGWYTLCFNADCPLHGNCMRFLAGSHAPETLETCRCVLPHTQKNGQCRWFDKIEVMTMAAGFTHLYDNVLKKDYTPMRWLGISSIISFCVESGASTLDSKRWSDGLSGVSATTGTYLSTVTMKHIPSVIPPQTNKG